LIWVYTKVWGKLVNYSLQFIYNYIFQSPIVDIYNCYNISNLNKIIKTLIMNYIELALKYNLCIAINVY
jgi:hypothetical protein